MAVPAQKVAGGSAPNASDFLELYRHERPAPALPLDEFLDQLRALIRAHPIDARLAHVLKYGGASREAMQRWIKDYYQWIRMDAQGKNPKWRRIAQVTLNSRPRLQRRDLRGIAGVYSRCSLRIVVRKGHRVAAVNVT